MNEYAGAPPLPLPVDEIKGIKVGQIYRRVETGEARKVRAIYPDRNWPSGYLVEYETPTGQGFADLDLFIRLTLG